MSLLLTGFRPFFPAIDTFVAGNSSEKIVNCFREPSPSLLERCGEDYVRIQSNTVTAVLQVKRGSANLPGTSAKSLYELMESYDLKGVVCLGHHLRLHGSTGAHLELVAYRPGDLKAGDREKRSWFADSIADDARALGITSVSRPKIFAAGTCNDTYWTALDWAGTRKAAAFLHLPPYIPLERGREEAIFRQVLFVLKRVLDLGSRPAP